MMAQKRKHHKHVTFLHTFFIHWVFQQQLFSDIDIVQMHNSTTDTIKDTYLFSIQQIFDNLHDVFLFVFLLNISMFVLQLRYQCRTD